MSLIVEDGSIVSGAESYASVAFADSYHSKRGNTNWATLSNDEKEQALRRATDYMVQLYRLRWKGDRVTSTQSLDWPRNWVAYDDYAYITQNGAQTIGGFIYYPADEVPAEVVSSCAELAIKAAAGELLAEQGQGVIREKVGPLEVEYDRNSPQRRRFPMIDGLLAPLLKAAGLQVVRT